MAMRRLAILWALFPAWQVKCMESATNISVGFDLKYTYGTAAISFPNGTSKAIARVDGDQSYRDTFRRLSLPTSERDAPPYTNPAQRWNDWPSQQKRKARKAVGLPASEDVGAISTVIRILKEETEKVIGDRITSAAASVPFFTGIYDEDMYDAFEYIGLEYIQLIDNAYHRSLLTYEPTSALAAYGFSMCPNIKHPQECWEGDGFLNDHYYVVVYTESSLLAYHVSAFSNGAYRLLITLAFDLNLGKSARYNNPHESYYWDAVRRVLLKPLLRVYYEEPTKIMLVGESFSDEALKNNLESILREFFNAGLPPIYDSDPVYTQAKGVAELVRRSVYLPRPQRPQIMALDQNKEGWAGEQQVFIDEL